MKDPIAELEQVLGLKTADAEDLLQLTFAADQSIAIRRYGYPKDNLIPPPMHERLVDSEYLEQLLLEAEDDDAFGGEIVAAIRAHLERIVSGNA